MNQAFHIWLYCVTSECAMLHTLASSHTVLHHVAYACICCCGYWVYEWVLWRMNAPFYIWMCHLTYKCVMWRVSCVTYRCATLHSTAWYAQYCVISRMNKASAVASVGRMHESFYLVFNVSQMNVFCHEWIYCVTYECVMAHNTASCHDFLNVASAVASAECMHDSCYI